MRVQTEQDNVVSTIVVGGVHIPIYQDEQELKRKRNRQAQRKHRQRMRANNSAKSMQNNESEEASPTLTDNSFPIYQNYEVVSAMDFSLPGFPESENDPSQMPDLDQHVTQQPEISFDNDGTIYFSENMGKIQDQMTQAHEAFPPENDLSLVYEMPHQHSPQFQSQAAHSSHTRREPEGSQQCLPLHHSPPPVTSNSDTTKGSHSSLVASKSDLNFSSRHEEQTKLNGSSHLLRSNDAESNSGHSDSEKPIIFSAGDLETRFEHVIKAVEEAGFESIDDMSAQYYTATFKKDTLPSWAQARSRRRSLHVFLATLHGSTSNWSNREVQGYRQQITGAAESLYLNEFLGAKKDILTNGNKRGHASSKKVSSSPTSQSAIGIQSLWQTLADMELNWEFKQKKTMIPEKMPEIWSLLVELTQKADLRQPQGSQVVCAFLFLLLESNPDSPIKL